MGKLCHTLARLHLSSASALVLIQKTDNECSLKKEQSTISATGTFPGSWLAKEKLAPRKYRAAIAVARIVMGPKMRVQAPPNLVSIEECTALLGAGVDDWGGVSPLTPDHVNPERPWPSLDRLRAVTAAAGLALEPRLTVHPEYVVGSFGRGEPWLDPRLSGHVAALARLDGPAGLARPDVRPRAGAGRSPTAASRPSATAPAAPTCTPPSTPRAAPPTAATTSTPSTAPGTRSRR